MKNQSSQHFVVCAAIGSSIAITSTRQNDISDLNPIELANIEALTRGESPNTADGYFLTNCYANTAYPHYPTGATCKLRNYYDQCLYSMSYGDGSDQYDE